MDQQQSPTTPIGVMLIAIFWIFIGIFFLSITVVNLSYPYFPAPLGLVLLLISIGIIMVGWGLLTLKRWAYITSLVFSVFGILYLVTFLPTLIFSFIEGYFFYHELSSYLPLLSLLFIPMIYYLVKKGPTYFKKKGETQVMICPSCGRIIPSDANHCPYCDYNFATSAPVK